MLFVCFEVSCAAVSRYLHHAFPEKLFIFTHDPAPAPERWVAARRAGIAKARRMLGGGVLCGQLLQPTSARAKGRREA